MAEKITYAHLPVDPCLTQDQMMGYIDGKLSTDVQHTCEKHMLDCEMCSDALEGLMLVKDRAVLTTPLTKSATATVESGKVIGLNQNPRKMWYAVAAVLVVVLGTTFFVNKIANGDGSMSVAESAETKNNSSPASGETEYSGAKADSTVATVFTQGGDQQKILNSPFEKNPAPGGEVLADEYRSKSEDLENEIIEGAPEDANEEALKKGESEMDAVVFAPEETVGGIAAKDNLQEESKEDADKKAKFWEVNKISLPPGDAKPRAEKQTLVQDRNDDKKQENAGASGTKEPDVVKNADVPASPQSGTSGNVVQTETYDQTVTDSVQSNGPFPLKPSDADLELSYTNGVKLLDSGQYNSALAFFDEVLKNKNHARFEDAEFQKANTLIKANRKPEAKVLLQSIEAKKGKYAAEATELLKSI